MRMLATAIGVSFLAASGGSWAELGGSASGGGIGRANGFYTHSLALDSSNRPVVAWDDDSSGNSEILVKVWDGSSWIERGGSGGAQGISSNSGASYNPSLRLDSFDNPVIAWNDGTSGNFEIYLKRWSGSAWIELGASATGGGISGFAAPSLRPSLALDSTGNPVVAWGENGEIYLKRWNGAAWVDIGGSAADGGISATAGSSLHPSLALDSSDRPVVAWRETTDGNDEVYLKRWDGANWVALGGSATGGGISANSGNSRTPSLRLDGAQNPSVAWWDTTSGSGKVYFKRWDGANWIELAGSASGTGVSNPSATSNDASLALDPYGNPMIAWTEYAPGNAEVYLKRWNGVNWIEVEGSATGAGISATAEDSIVPSLALDSSGNPVVTWIETDFAVQTNLYLRRLLANEAARAEDGSGGGDGGGGGGGGCGLLGLEAALFFLLLGRRRRMAG